ncbi:MAG: carbohydrate binding family 9 domain-containing protein [Sphingobacteriaceae bacterium]|nr:carbohydrate binding family 9 domain-containing protein [Sphingobacteriaceae bacterium]
MPLISHTQVKELKAIRIYKTPKIDGLDADSCWNGVDIAKNFIQRDLHPGVESELETEVKLVYDDDAIYIFAKCFDTSTDSILKELSVRDNEANAELFGVFLDTYNDDINAFGFFVTSAGTQIDARYSENNQDFNWNAVWLSEVKINGNGWYIEMKIPYSAIRFSDKEQQTWGINFIRKIRRKRENSFWNPIDPKIAALVRQFGDLTGIENIKPPVRLSLTPYVAGIANHYPHQDKDIKDFTYNMSGGMDVKYGINDAFTLDMTLVPDFSQVQSDNQVLNLTQFEVQFQERRPFFTEGTELFNKGGLFYSRRVGGVPYDAGRIFAEQKPDEKIIKNPSQTQLLNATKFSGRTAKKLGIGIFNGVANNTYGTLQDSTGHTRNILTSPLTNYNITVFDQFLPNNSFVTLINTNVTREGHYRDANVSGGLFRFNTKTNKYTISGKGVMSNIFNPGESTPYSGYQTHFEGGKNGGQFTYNVYHTINSDQFDPNDLGILNMRNNTEAGLVLHYRIFKPFWKVNNLNNTLRVVYQRMFNPNAFWNFGVYGNSNTTFTKHFFTCGIDYGIEPILTYDYYEARIQGRYYEFPINYNMGGFISSDYRKKFALDIRANYKYFIENLRTDNSISISPRYRVNDKLSFIYEVSNTLQDDNIGFVNYNYLTDTITFGRRNLQTVSNIFSGALKFNNKMAVTFRMRHYWSTAKYLQYYTLLSNGKLQVSNYSNNHDVNFNAFNIDVVYFWQFAPGSELNIVWKSALLSRVNQMEFDYYTNFRSSLNSPQDNLLSIKLLYYLDFNQVKKGFRKRTA